MGPVSRFAEMVRSIFHGAFCPDAERSQYFPFPPAPPAEEFAQGLFEKQADELGVEAAEPDFCKVEWPEVSSEQHDVVDRSRLREWLVR